MGALLLVGVLFGLIGLAVLIGGIVAAVKQSRKSARGVNETKRQTRTLRRLMDFVDISS